MKLKKRENRPKKVVRIKIVPKKTLKLKKKVKGVKKEPKQRKVVISGERCGECYHWLHPKINKFYHIHEAWAECGAGCITNGTGRACQNYLDPNCKIKRRAPKVWKMKTKVRKKVWKLPVKKKEKNSKRKVWKITKS